MRGDLKVEIVNYWERFKAFSPSYKAVAAALGADHDYVAFVLRTHRGNEDPRQALPSDEAHAEHIRRVVAALPRGQGFPYYPSSAWSRP